MEAGQTPVNAMLSQSSTAQSLPYSTLWKEESSELATCGPTHPGDKELGENTGH